MNIVKNMGGWLMASAAALALLIGSATAAPKDTAACPKKCGTCACCKDCKGCAGCGKAVEGKKAKCCDNCKCADAACCAAKKASCSAGKEKSGKGCNK